MSRYAELGIEMLEKANADLEPDLMTQREVEQAFELYSRAERLVAYGKTMLARRMDEAKVARISGTSLGKAKTVVATGNAMESSPELSHALQHGDVSLDQAVEIASAEQSSPGSAKELLKVAETGRFHVLRDEARRIKLEAEQHRDLHARQRAARSGRSHTDALGMVDIHLRFEPHIGTPILARAEAEAQRLARTARAEAKEAELQARNEGGDAPRAVPQVEPFERYMADAYAKLLSGAGKGRTNRPELVILVSHEVAKRGWTDVRDGETCKIPGVGPVAPEVAKEIAQDAFLTGLFYDGKDLRNVRRWSRSRPAEVAIALELGEPPSFDGVACIDCGNRFRTEFDHAQPHVARGPASYDNLKPRCWPCHQAKTERDRRAGRLKPPEP
ncbi:MAG: HNH endonuclease [Actinomycetota bacterium]|nr:HNH endonuclease [Actinomycetota bacterium]